MRWFINYLRQCFCNHEFEYEEKLITTTHYDFDNVKTRATVISALCKKCAYHKRMKKFCD